MSSITTNAVIGTLGGGAFGFVTGGIPGSMALSQLGLAAGAKVGLLLEGSNILKDVINRTAEKVSSFTDTILATGLLGFAYWGTFEIKRAECMSNPREPLCVAFPYITLSIAIVTGSAIIYTITKLAQSLHGLSNNTNNTEKASTQEKEPFCSCNCKSGKMKSSC